MSCLEEANLISFFYISCHLSPTEKSYIEMKNIYIYR